MSAFGKGYETPFTESSLLSGVMLKRIPGKGEGEKREGRGREGETREMRREANPR